MRPFKSKTVNQVSSAVNTVSKVYGITTTGYKSSTILLTALKSWTTLYVPSGFWTSNMGELKLDSHSFNKPQCKNLSNTSWIPSLSSFFKGYCFILSSLFKLYW